MHGWTPHGQPCCPRAPIAERPDVVTACANSIPTGSGCVVCLMYVREALHEARSWKFTAPDADRLVVGLGRVYFPGGATFPISNIIIGPYS